MVFVVCFFFLREKMAQAYDFALDKIGMEIMSYQVCFFFQNTFNIYLYNKYN